MKSIFWFRQDLRTFDNIWLTKAFENSSEILPIFILDKNILERFPQNDKRLGFLKDALIKLDQELQSLGSFLLVKIWKPEEIIPQLVQEYQIEKVFCNKSYWNYGTQRDSKIKSLINADFESFEDFFLINPYDVPVRKVFTPFFKQWKPLINFEWFSQIKWKIKSPNIQIQDINAIFENISYWENKYWDVYGWDKILSKFDFCNYWETRNLPYIDGTSKLSPYTRFWLVSVRQIYDAIKKSDCDDEIFLSEIAWREFWNHIMINFPWTEDLEFLEKRRWIAWQNDEKLFNAWKEWKTGYPLVDAGMRQLKEENWIHNRVRMVVASFLTKDLLIDRRWWERYFEDYLIDYDRNVNIWNWQWAASVWADPKPLRIFNPMLQSQRFDPNCDYIKKYIPELKNYEPGQIHNPLRYNLSYAKPVIDHFENSKLAKELYSNAWK